MNVQDGLPKGRCRDAAPWQYRTLFNELSMLYLELWLGDRAKHPLPLRVDVADEVAPLPSARRWYQTLLDTWIPSILPTIKRADCWTLPSVELEGTRMFIYLYLQVETGQPYVLFSGQATAGRFVPERLPLKLTVRDLNAIIGCVRCERIHVQALIALQEH